MTKAYFSFRLFTHAKVFVSIIALAFLSGCQTSPLDVQSITKEGIELSSYESVSVEALDKPGKFIQMMTKGIKTTLLNKGYKLEENADLVFLYQVDVREDQELRQSQLNAKRHVYNRMTLEAVYEAKVLINAIDTKTNQVVWKASTSKDLRAVNKEQIDQSRISLRMAELLETFPSR